MTHELSFSRDGFSECKPWTPTNSIEGRISEEEIGAFGEALLALPDRKQTLVGLVVAAACEAGIAHVRSAPPLHRPWLRPGKGRSKQFQGRFGSMEA